MALPLWGQQEKAQDDPQTIDEAIAAAIVEHEADPEAHLGSGESLEMHKTQEIIDHPQSSVLADKISSNQSWLFTTFETLNGWNVVGNSPQLSWPGFLIQTNSTTGHRSSLNAEGLGGQFSIDMSKNPSFQTNARLDQDSEIEAWISLGDDPYSDLFNGVGFKLIDDIIYGYVASDEDYDEVELSGVASNDKHVFRAQVDSDLLIAYFFVDGIQRGSLSFSEPTGSTPSVFTFSVRTTENSSKRLYATQLFISQDI